MLKSIMVVVVAGAGASVARADLVVTSVSGLARIDGYAAFAGFDGDDYDASQSLTAPGEIATLVDEALSGTARSAAVANSTVSLVPLGFQAISSNSASASRPSTDAGSLTDITVLFSLTTAGPLSVQGRFHGDMSFPGGRSYFADGILELYNPSGGLIFRRNYHGTGATVDELIPSAAAGNYRIVFQSTASAIDAGGGGFSGGSASGVVDITVTAVPAPGAGAGLLTLAGLPIMRRRR